MEHTQETTSRAFDPTTWPDPDTIGSSEYRTIHAHALEVWESNESEPDPLERAEYVRASLEEMSSHLEALLNEEMQHPTCSNCGESYELDGDGYDGLCPTCADEAAEEDEDA
jgi:tRNA(Ile2) C34 agmatinyltransferase TiaS